MKIWYYVIGVVLIFVIGCLVGYHSRGESAVQIYSDTTIVKEYIHDTTWCYDTVIVTAKDTLFITPDMPLGQVPVRELTDHDSIPVRAGDKVFYIPYDLAVLYRGLIYNYSLTTRPRPYLLTLPKPKEKWLTPYAAATVSLDIQKRLLSEIESGIDIKNRVWLFIRYQADSLDVFNGEFRAGCRAVLK